MSKAIKKKTGDNDLIDDLLEDTPIIKVTKTKPKPKPKTEDPVSEIKATKNSTDISNSDLLNELNELKTLVKSLQKEFKGLVEINQRLIHERLGVAPPPPPKEYGEESTSKSSKAIEIQDFTKGRIKVSGNTFKYKDSIKDAGGCKWEGDIKSWSLPIDSLNKLIINLEDLELVNGKDFVVNVKGKSKSSTKSKDDDEESPRSQRSTESESKSKSKTIRQKIVESDDDGHGFGDGLD